MSELTISTNDDETNDVTEITDIIETAQEAEAQGMAEGLIIGELAGKVENITSQVESLKNEMLAQQAEQRALIIELLGNIDRMETEAEVIEATGEAEAEVIEAEAELVEAEAEAEAEVIETEAEAEAEIVPGSRGSHWYFRPRHEWNRD